MSDTKAEIDEIFARRPPNDQTEWSFATDVSYGNPIERCFCCGHEKQRHWPWGSSNGKSMSCCSCKTFI